MFAGSEGRGTSTPVPMLNLPPLPPTGGEITGRNAVDVLREQHADLLDLCDGLVPVAPGSTRFAASTIKIQTVLIATLSRHLSAEEQYLYPAVRKVVPGGDELAARELAEDTALLVELKKLDQGADNLATVIDLVRRHVAADDQQLLPVLTREAPVEDLIRVGNRIELAEEAAPTRPHPGTPSKPPWNKVVDPAVAVVDKVRDAVTGRTTYVRDLPSCHK